MIACHEDFERLLNTGHTLEQQQRLDEAIAVYERAIVVNPGHATAFTRRARLRYRLAFGPPPTPVTRSADAPRLTMSTLGANGRFGNQLLQYGFLRMYAAAHDLVLEAPDWIGRDIFELDDPLTVGSLPVVSENDADFVASLNKEVPYVFANADLWGYCCYPTGRLRRYRELFRSLFRPGRQLACLVEPALQRLRENAQTIVAVHLRRGDFGCDPFWIAPTSWYKNWLDALWPRLQRPVLYVASDDSAAAIELAHFAPLTAADFDVTIPGLEFYLDFYLLSCADAVAISNSSFSFVAAMLNEHGQTFVRPDRQRGELLAFDPWDSPVVL